MSEPEPSEGERDDAALDELRIRQYAQMRRALYRSRAYAVIAAIACAAGAAQCAYLAVQRMRSFGWDLRTLVFFGLMIVAAGAGAFFAKRAMALAREAEQTRIPEPTTPPDFSTLSDGSQRAKNLEEIR